MSVRNRVILVVGRLLPVFPLERTCSARPLTAVSCQMQTPRYGTTFRQVSFASKRAGSSLVIVSLGRQQSWPRNSVDRPSSGLQIENQRPLSINVSWLALRVEARVSASRILHDVLLRTRVHIGWRSTACLPASPADTGAHRRYRAGRPAKRRPGTRPADHRKFDIRAFRSRQFPEIRQITRTSYANN